MTRRRVGSARRRTGLKRRVGKFVLADGLAYPGAMTPAAAIDAVFNEWDRQVESGRLDSSTIDLYKKHVVKFRAFIARRPLTTVHEIDVNLVIDWINTARHDNDGDRALNSMYLRRSIIRAVYITLHDLGYYDVNVASSIELPPRETPKHDSVTDADVQTLMSNSALQLGDTKSPAALALTLLGAATREASYVRCCDIDFANCRVWLHDGGERFRDRWVPMKRGDWAFNALRRRVTELERTHGVEGAAERCVCYDSRTDDPAPEVRQAAVAGTIQKVMKAVDIYVPGKRRVDSIRTWVARTLYKNCGRIEVVAERLSINSLDATADLLGLDWVEMYRIDAPAPEGSES